MKLKYIIPFGISMFMLSACTQKNIYSEIENELSDFAKEKDAEIGVAVIVDGRDTIALNGDKRFPMLSVYKFPIAVGVGEYCRSRQISFRDSCVITPAQLLPNTWSPMRQVYGSSDTLSLPISQLLGYAIQQSDNNASDILLAMVGGAKYVHNHIAQLNFDGIEIKWTEDEMHRDIARSYENTATPIAMARLLDRFYVGHKDPLSMEIKALMENCATGKDRLAKPLNSIPGVTIGHKTGTGDTNPDGRIIAVNDAGYVVLPDRKHYYTIAVFIKDSAYNLQETSALIADISTIVYSKLSAKSH